MPKFFIPNNASLHTVRAFLQQESLFSEEPDEAILEFHPKWVHMEPLALAMVAAWGKWCQDRGHTIRAINLGPSARYAARMRLFQVLNIDFDPDQQEHEEAGRFLPLTQVSNRQEVGPVIANISALLHLEEDPESLAAVQYCLSELLRNTLEHSNAHSGAFVCAHRFAKKGAHRVSIGVADCGQGIAAHLGRAHKDALKSDEGALGLAMRPGITGALPGMYGTPDNAGAGLFITRCIAKGTGGYFALVSGNAGFRQRRSLSEDDEVNLHIDAFDDPRHDRWELASPWKGTAVAIEIRTDRIANYQGFFQWIFRQIPSRGPTTRRIKFT
jgi:anti-sigma regulatory factor (Ser/Thr protein kinase)